MKLERGCKIDHILSKLPSFIASIGRFKERIETRLSADSAVLCMKEFTSNHLTVNSC